MVGLDITNPRPVGHPTLHLIFFFFLILRWMLGIHADDSDIIIIIIIITHPEDIWVEALEAGVRLADEQEHVDDGVGVVQVGDGLVNGQHDALHVVLQHLAGAKLCQSLGWLQALEEAQDLFVLLEQAEAQVPVSR